jgi:hypothetical protein
MNSWVEEKEMEMSWAGTKPGSTKEQPYEQEERAGQGESCFSNQVRCVSLLRSKLVISQDCTGRLKQGGTRQEELMECLRRV